jgi:hypothetical protein
MPTTKRSRSDGIPDEYEIYSNIRFDGAEMAGGSYPVTIDRKKMTDYVTSNYHQVVRDGGIVNHPMTYEETTLKTSGTGHYYAQYLTHPEWYYNGVGPITAIYMAFMSREVDQGLHNVADLTADGKLRDMAKQSALANVDSSPYEFGEDLFELRETIQFLRNPLTALQQAAKAFSARKRYISKMTDAKRKAKALAGLWNQYRFAMSPLIRSCLTALEAFNDRSSNPATRRTARGFASDRDEFLEEGVEHDLFGGAVELSTNDLEWVTVKTHAAILYEVSNPLYDWKFKLGLRLKDIPTTMWQVFPLSFMVDRLYNISNAIRGAMNLLDPSISILAANVTYRQKSFRQCSLQSINQPGYYVEISSDHVEYFRYNYWRDPYTVSVSDIKPTLDWEYPVKDITHITDLIAIILSLIK